MQPVSCALWCATTARACPPRSAAASSTPFFTTKAVGQGTGVGLSVCHSIVGAHGGTIAVDEAEGGGAFFTVLLPASEAPAAAPDPGPDPQSGTARRVLVVDDEPDITGFLVEILEASGHRVEIASSGLDALSRLAKQDYDVIICDLRMPHLDGAGLYDALKDNRPHLLERMIFVPCDLMNENTDRFLKQSARPCIEKPFLPGQIRELVEEVGNTDD